MTNWEQFEPYITPENIREKLGSAKHENNNVQNNESDWLASGRKIDLANTNVENSYFTELEKRFKK